MSRTAPMPGRLWRWGPSLLLFGIVALAAALRLWNLDAIGLRGDEAVYAGQAAVIAGDEHLSRYFVLASRGNSNFLLFQGVVSLFYSAFGVSDVLARVVSAGFSVLTVLLTFELGRTLYGRRAGLAAALLLAVSGYAVALGRLAFLDPAMVCCFTLAMLCAAKWTRGRDSRWLYAFSAATALAMQAKITACLAIAVFALFMLVSGHVRSLRPRVVLASIAVFVAVFSPALAQLATSSPTGYVGFLSTSTKRASAVPWHYYLSRLLEYESALVLLAWGVGLALAARRRTPADVLCITWVLVVVAFFQLYPLKGFNYLLPIVPALCVLAARAILARPLPGRLPAVAPRRCSPCWSRPPRSRCVP